MTATTPLGLPYPEVTDRVADGWDAIRDLAEAADALIAARATIASLTTINTTLTAAVAALDARLDTLEALTAGTRLSALEALSADSAWIAPTLNAYWTNYSGFVPARYRRKAGIVHLQGLVAGVPGNTAHIFTLPVGFRPNQNLILDAAVGGSAYLVDPVSTRLNVTAAGVVSIDENSRNGAGGITWQSLSGVSFPADQ